MIWQATVNQGFIRAREKLNSSFSFGQVSLTCCLPGVTPLCMFSYKVTLLQPLFIVQMSLKSYSPNKKIYLPRTTRWDVLFNTRSLLLVHAVIML